jgi:hypothetical protein
MLRKTAIIQQHENSNNKSTLNLSSTRQNTSIIKLFWRKNSNNDNGHTSKLNDPTIRSKKVLYNALIFLCITILVIIGVFLIFRIWSNRYFHNYPLEVGMKENINHQGKVSKLRLLTVPRAIWDDDFVDPSMLISNGNDMTKFIHCNVSTDVRGNLGPAIVLTQN